MARKTSRAKLKLTGEQFSKLDQLSNSRKAPLREIQRAKVLLLYADETSISQIQKLVGVSRPTIYKCIDKALAAGVDAGLEDYFHRPFDPVIDDSAKAWVINVACMKPKDLGLAAELWTYRELAKYTCNHAPAAGHPSLSKAVKATVWRILFANEIRPIKSNIIWSAETQSLSKKCRKCLSSTKRSLSKMTRVRPVISRPRQSPCPLTKNPVFRPLRSF
ncbi:MAG: helix-turn-helix domain-containing protein, partial [Desulfuromusa sp.]|nr:helix-turn-helix domain-containing protein [Desulfuromusa sp.]